MISKIIPPIIILVLILSFSLAGTALSETTATSLTPTGFNGSLSPEGFDVTKEKVSALQKAFSETQGVSEEDITRYTAISNQILAALDKITEQKVLKEKYIRAQNSAEVDHKELENKLADFKEFIPELEQIQGADISAAESTLSQVQLDYNTAKQISSELENEPQRRAKRITEIPELISKYQESFSEINQKLLSEGQGAPGNSIQYIESLKNKVQSELYLRSIEAVQEELKAYEATKTLLPLRRDLAARNLNKLEKRLKFWQETVNTLRKKKLQEIKKEAVTAAEEVKYSNKAAQDIAKEINALAKKQSELLGTIETTSEHLQNISGNLKNTQDDYVKTKELISKSAKVTSTMGMLLQTKKETLPETKQNEKNIKNRFDLISTAQLEWRKYDDMWSRLLDVDSVSASLLEESGIVQSAPDYQESFDKLKSLLNQKRQILSIISGYYVDYLTLLAQVDAQERDLIDVVEQYNYFIDKNILWVKSGLSFNKQELKNSLISIRAIFSERSFKAIWEPIVSDFKFNYISYSLVFALAGILLGLHKWFISKIRSYSEKITRTDTDRFSHTLNTLILSVAASLPVAIILSFITWRYHLIVSESSGIPNLLDTYKNITIITFVFFLLRWFSLKGGLGSHLRFEKKVLSTFRNNTIWLYVFVVSITLIYGVLQSSELSMEVKNAGLRFLFIIEQVVISIFLMIIFNPKGEIARQLQEEFHTDKTVKHLRYFWFIVIISIPLTFSVISIIGYTHAALHLHYKLAATLFFYLTVLFFNRLLLRALYISRRKLALKKLREQKEMQSVHKDNPELIPADLQREEIHDSILNISKQSKQIINVISTLVVIVGIWWIWKSTLPALEAFEKIQLGKTFDKSSGETIIISLGSALKAIAIIILTVFTAKNIPGLLEITILQKLKFNSGARFAFTSLSKYLISVVGIIYSFSTLGIRWSTVQWLVAAVTVGLGFGLQEIFANFISGLIILFEQPIRVGDCVTIGDVSGIVSQIKIRATTIVKWDRKELLVPNKEFITGRLINWTLSDQILRLEFPVGIAYGSDIKKAESVLYDIAENCEDVIHDDPKPRVIFKAFGGSSLDFELRVYIRSLSDYLDVWHKLNCEIDTEFRKNGIEISFPQRDLHLKSIDFPLPGQGPKDVLSPEDR